MTTPQSNLSLSSTLMQLARERRCMQQQCTGAKVSQIDRGHGEIPAKRPSMPRCRKRAGDDEILCTCVLAGIRPM